MWVQALRILGNRSMPFRRTSLVAGLLLALVAGPVSAGSLYLNGVNIDGVINQKFEKAVVRIDDKGNVFIEAPGYQAKAVDTGDPQAQQPVAAKVVGATGENLTKRYWLVTEQTVTGMAEYDIDVYVNSRWLRKLKSTEEQLVIEVTKQLNLGKNTVLLAAHKVPSEPRKSFSADHVFRVIVGEGDVGGDNVLIDKALVDFKRTAADAQDVSKEFTFTAR